MVVERKDLDSADESDLSEDDTGVLLFCQLNHNFVAKVCF